MKYGALLFLALGLIACNKDQRAVNRLEGTWNATKWEVSQDGLTLDLIALGGSATVIFDQCDVSSSWCDYTAYTSFLGESDTINSLYRVTNAGATLELKDSTSTNSSEIVELTDSFFRLRDNVSSPSVVIEASK